MDILQYYFSLFTLLFSVTSCAAECYYYTYSYYCYSYVNYYYGYVNYYYGYYVYWDTARIVGSAVGGGISLIVAIVVIIVLCRVCRGRRAFQGTTYTNGQAVSTVTTNAQQQNMAYYPQQFNYGQPVGMAGYNSAQPVGVASYNSAQPVGVAGYNSAQPVGVAGYNSAQPVGVAGYNNSQPVGVTGYTQPVGVAGYNYGQPGQHPMTGYNNTAFSPPPYDQINFPTKTIEPASAPPP